jgi:hypothetical protein
MSSHREAPQISKDPVADSTDVYAFVSPDAPDTVTLIANYLPLQLPDGGPNFYEFGDDVLYEIHVDNTGDGTPDISYQFTFTSTYTTPASFLYNTGPIESVDSPNWNRKQTFDLTMVTYPGGVATPKTIATGLACPPCNIGPLSTPNYPDVGYSTFHRLDQNGFNGMAFAGQRADGFYVDLGAIFDLGNLRPFEELHNMFGLKNTGLGKMAEGVNSITHLDVHTLAIQVPITDVVAGGTMPTSPTASNAVIGVWTTASRYASTVRNADGTQTNTGAYVQVSRLGQPLINEVLIPIGTKDFWNAQSPSGDKQFVANYSNPELSQLLPTLYPGVFPNLAKYNAGTPNRADLVAILLTGIPKGVISSNFTTQINGSTVQADELRLNVAIPPAKGSNRNNLGLLGGDVSGYPNGRRVFDDVATIELRALAGATLPLVDPSFKADAAAGEITFGLTSSPTDLKAKNTERYIDIFPYLGRPIRGFAVKQIDIFY